MAPFRANQIDSGFDTFVGGIGTDMPLSIYMESGKSGGDLFLPEEKHRKVPDPEVTQVGNSMLTLMRRYEFTLGAYRPGLTYHPVKK